MKDLPNKPAGEMNLGFGYIPDPSTYFQISKAASDVAKAIRSDDCAR